MLPPWFIGLIEEFGLLGDYLDTQAFLPALGDVTSFPLAALCAVPTE
jgi:hypothetical protein